MDAVFPPFVVSANSKGMEPGERVVQAVSWVFADKMRYASLLVLCVKRDIMRFVMTIQRFLILLASTGNWSGLVR